MARILSVDFGRRRIGLAVCDELQISVRGLPTLKVRNFNDSVAQVAQVAGDEAVGEVVIGLPLNMDGSRGDMAQVAENFASQLAVLCNIPVRMFDERLSSVGAKRELDAMQAKKRKGEIDRMAAVLILETYLQHKGR
ncbi:MAG: Holliday junction resolvase RuvX [Gemmatimonadota bacterium]|nr:Holliday junction resolvase RuvX [Gemmatimonadota bacterium]MDE2831595.1 Holliday junction resolvase RuvX [Gemmatimonadota bacterium]MDE2952963.1 Holliday junction resolvase RuvX [Gemmatimonadota bacterium]